MILLNYIIFIFYLISYCPAFTISPWVFNFGIASSLTMTMLFEVAPKPIASASQYISQGNTQNISSGNIVRTSKSKSKQRWTVRTKVYFQSFVISCQVFLISIELCFRDPAFFHHVTLWSLTHGFQNCHQRRKSMEDHAGKFSQSRSGCHHFCQNPLVFIYSQGQTLDHLST